MKTVLALVFLFCFASQACALSPGEHYQVHFSPNVTNEVHTQIEEQAAQWSNAVGVKFDFVQGGNCEMRTYCIYVEMATSQIGDYTIPRGQQEGETTVNTANQSSDLHILTTTQPASLPRTALHELGHALGLMHSDDSRYTLTEAERKGAIMFPYWSSNTPSFTLTDADIKMYYQDRHVSTSGMKEGTP